MSDVPFDINVFKGSRVEVPILTTKPQIPAGRWQAKIASLKGDETEGVWSRVIMPQPGGKAKSPRLEVPFEIIDSAVMQEMGRNQPPILTQSYWLNLNSASQLDPKNNSELGQLFAAVGVTTGGIEALLQALPGAGPFWVTVGKDPRGTEYMRVLKVEPLG